ncbi:MAG: hypothetical protein Q7T48_09325 [Cellvibrio sp.]|uniref:hypothetical protein n=1 Tax=Cellvibrio sp. TaxID=1965322 RepID=UPI002715BE34|nr:hypothetical protein [Cellvibrio sp.]
MKLLPQYEKYNFHTCCYWEIKILLQPACIKDDREKGLAKNRYVELPRVTHAKKLYAI